MKVGTILKVSAVVVVGLVVAGVGVLLSIDVNQYKDVITAEAEKATGRKLVIEGDMAMAIGLSPAVTVSGVRFGNADWGTEPNMVSVDRFEAEVALLPALTGTIEIKRIVLVKPVIVLETKGKTANWTFDTAASGAGEAPTGDAAPASQNAGATPALPAVGSVSIEDGLLIFRDLDAKLEHKVAIKSFTAETDSIDDPLSLALEGAYNETAFSAQGMVGPVAHVLDAGGTPYPVALKGAVAGIEYSLDGTIADVQAVTGLNFKAMVKADSLEGLKPFVGDLPALPPLSVAMVVTGQPDIITLSAIDLSVGQSKVTGTVKADLRGARPVADVVLQAALVDLGELLGESAGEKGGSGGSGAAGGSNADGKVLPTDPLPLGALKAADSTFDIAVAKLVMPDGVEFDGLSLKGTLKNGRLGVAPMQARLGEGQLTVNAVLDASSGKSAGVSVDVDAKKIVLGKLFEQLKRPDLMTGTPTDMTIGLKGGGVSVSAIAGSLNGAVLVKMGQGRVHNDLIDWAGADIINQLAEKLNPFGEKTPYTELACGVINTKVKAGVVTWDRQIAFETSKMYVVSTGTTDMGKEALDIAVRPYNKGGVGVSAGKLAELVRLGGTYANPSVGLDAMGAAKTAASIAGAIATGGISLLAENVLTNTAQDTDPCATALLANPDTSPTAGTAAPAEAPAQQTAPSPLEEVGKGLNKLFGQ